MALQKLAAILIAPLLLHAVACEIPKKTFPPTVTRDLSKELRCAELPSVTFGRCTGDCDQATYGGREFVPLREAEQLPITAGFQGSSMFDLSLRAEGLAPNGVLVQLSATDAEGTVRQYWELEEYFEQTGPESLHTAHLAGLALRGDFPLGEPVRVDVYLLDADGNGQCGSRTVQIGL